MSDTESGKPDVTTQLAYENIYLAHERTQIAWVQLALALITFGFTLAKFFQYLQETQRDQNSHVSARAIGLMMILLGVASLVISTALHGRVVRALRARCPSLPVSQSGILSMVLAILGVGAVVGIVLR